jgi:RimJ/RimL family protein N-acetyltransferase
METLDADSVLDIISQQKQGPGLPDGAHLIRQNGRGAGWLIPVTWADADSRDAVALLADWRQAASDAFPTQFPVTLDGTESWIRDRVLAVPDRLLFWVTDLDGTRIGHMGLFHFDPRDRHLGLDNVVRGVPDVIPGIMLHGVRVLLEWTFTALDMNAMFLRVFSDNERALRLYERCGFEEILRIPVARVEEGPAVRWVEVDGSYRQPVHRYFVTMRLQRSEWQAVRKRSQAA